MYSFSRRDFALNNDKLSKIVSADTDAWKTQFPSNAEAVFSGIATTRAQAGSLEKQKLIDCDLQVELAKAAKEKGCKCFVLVSSLGASLDSMFGYLRMKAECEQEIIKLGFDKTIILRPGGLLGERQGQHKGFGQSLINTIMPWFHRSALQGLVKYPVEGEEVAKVALQYVQDMPNGLHIVESKEIIERANA